MHVSERVVFVQTDRRFHMCRSMKRTMTLDCHRTVSSYLPRGRHCHPGMRHRWCTPPLQTYVMPTTLRSVTPLPRYFLTHDPENANLET